MRKEDEKEKKVREREMLLMRKWRVRIGLERKRENVK